MEETFTTTFLDPHKSCTKLTTLIQHPIIYGHKAGQCKQIVITMLVCHQYAKLITCQSAYITNDHNSTTYIYEKFTKTTNANIAIYQNMTDSKDTYNKMCTQHTSQYSTDVR